MHEGHFAVCPQRRSGDVSALWCEPAKKNVVQARANVNDSEASPEMWAHAKFCSQGWTMNPSQEEHKFPTQR